MGDETSVLPLPPAPAPGTTTVKHSSYNVEVTNKAGYLCSLHLKADFDVPHTVIFEMLTYPDNSALFRDIHRVGERYVIEDNDKQKVVEVSQHGEIKVLWMTKTYTTWLKVTEETSDPECLVITFDLLRSCVLGKFSGRWELCPIRDDNGVVIGTRSELYQAVLPKGVPSFVKNIPVLGDMLRGVTARAITRLVDDMLAYVDKLKRSDKTSTELLREMCGEHKDVYAPQHEDSTAQQADDHSHATAQHVAAGAMSAAASSSSVPSSHDAQLQQTPSGAAVSGETQQGEAEKQLRVSSSGLLAPQHLGAQPVASFDIRCSSDGEAEED